MIFHNGQTTFGEQQIYKETIIIQHLLEVLIPLMMLSTIRAMMEFMLLMSH